MAETLGSLCDKLITVKLKEQHIDDTVKLRSLSDQEQQLIAEINEYFNDAFSGKILVEKLVFSPNKQYYKQDPEIKSFTGEFGDKVSELATTTCELWHVQEQVYAFDQVPPEEKDKLIQKQSKLNYRRSRIIEEIDIKFKKLVQHLRR